MVGDKVGGFLGRRTLIDRKRRSERQRQARCLMCNDCEGVIEKAGRKVKEHTQTKVYEKKWLKREQAGKWPNLGV